MNDRYGFVKKMVEQIPALLPIYDEHIRDYDEVLPHLLMGDITMYVVSNVIHEQDLSVVKEVLKIIENGLSERNPSVTDVILASFVENLIGNDTAVRWIILNSGPLLKRSMLEIL